MEHSAGRRIPWVCVVDGPPNIDQARGPLAGRVTGEYRNTSIHAIQAAVRYQF
jgi:hypothetical protein